MDEASARLRLIALIIFVVGAGLAIGTFSMAGSVVGLVCLGGLVFLLLGVGWLLSGLGGFVAAERSTVQDEVRKARQQYQQALREQKDMADRFQQLTLLSDLLAELAAARDLDHALDTVLRHTMEHFGAQHGFVMLLDEETEELYVEYALAADEHPVQRGRLKLGEGIPGKVALNGQPVLLGDSGDLRRKLGQEPPAHGIRAAAAGKQTLMCAPLRMDQEIIGVITIEQRRQGVFSEHDLDFLSLIAQETSMAIEKSRILEEMERMAITDALTQVYNRRHMEKELRREMARAQRTGNPLAVAMLDIDKFKNFNDTYGHAVGDNVLRGVAQILRENSRETDIVARYGGEEFIVVMPDCSADDAAAQAERMRRIVAETTFEGNEEHPQLSVTISLGVAAFPENVRDQHSLLKGADDALYLAKETGRNRVCRFEDLTTRATATA